MLKWEYTNIGTNNLEDPRIANLGRIGWELVTVFLAPAAASPFSPKAITVMVLMFKRELTDDAT